MAKSSFFLDAAAANAAGEPLGLSKQAFSFSLPAATVTMPPAATRSATALSRNWLRAEPAVASRKRNEKLC